MLWSQSKTLFLSFGFVLNKAKREINFNTSKKQFLLILPAYQNRSFKTIHYYLSTFCGKGFNQSLVDGRCVNLEKYLKTS